MGWKQHVIIPCQHRINRKEVFVMSLVFDEYGRPFIILREQQEQARIKGLEAQKVNILNVVKISDAFLG